MFGTGAMALSLGLCLCAGQLVATQAASAAPVAVTAASAQAQARVLPSMSLSVNRKVITPSQYVTITATVKNSKTGKAVTSGRARLQVYTRSWSNAKTVDVKAGKVTFVHKPGGTVYYRVQFLGTDGVRDAVTKATTVTVNKGNKASKVLAEAAKHKGALYLYGAAGPKRFDCSGFTMYVFKKAVGKKLPHKANSQQKYGKGISKGSKKPGDLIISRSGSYGYHVAIYAGNGYIWDSPHSGARVSKRKMFGTNYVVRRLV